MCEDGLHDPFTDQVECARFRAERDALAQRMEEVASEIDRTLSGVEGIEDAPAMRWARGLREALGSLHAPRIGYEDIEAARWVREHGGLENVKANLAALELFAEGIEIDTGRAFYDESMGERCAALRNEVKSRLMPEGMEWLLEVWPKWSNGEYCRFGDWWTADKYGDFEPRQLRRLVFYTPEQLREWEQDEGDNFGYEWDFMRPSDTTYRPDKSEPPVPKVLDADGVEIRVGDTVYFTDGRRQECNTVVNAEYDYKDEPYVQLGRLNEVGYPTYTNCSCIDPSQLTHRAPVLAADGEQLREGETVWDTNGDELVVGAIEDGGHTVTCRYVDVGDAIPVHGMWSPSDLTHERPDSWERIEADCMQDAKDYCEEHGIEPEYPKHSGKAKCEDLVRRAKALAGVSE